MLGISMATLVRVLLGVVELQIQMARRVGVRAGRRRGSGLCRGFWGTSQLGADGLGDGGEGDVAGWTASSRPARVAGWPLDQQPALERGAVGGAGMWRLAGRTRRARNRDRRRAGGLLGEVWIRGVREEVTEVPTKMAYPPPYWLHALRTRGADDLRRAARHPWVAIHDGTVVGEGPTAGSARRAARLGGCPEVPTVIQTQ